jgi:membrane-bound inhibitor of C-type lysozyme
MKNAAAFLFLASLGTPAFAEDVTLSLPDAPQAERTTVRYECAGAEPFEVEYVNAGPNSLAIVPVEGQHLVFAGVISGSGARYASGPYVWWTKGAGADLYDVRLGEDASPTMHCEEAASR